MSVSMRFLEELLVLPVSFLFHPIILSTVFRLDSNGRDSDVQFARVNDRNIVSDVCCNNMIMILI